MKETFCAASEEAKAVRAGDEVLREMSRSPSVEKERCSRQESPEISPNLNCRPCPHKTLQVCGYTRSSPGHDSLCCIACSIETC